MFGSSKPAGIQYMSLCLYKRINEKPDLEKTGVTSMYIL